MKDKLPQRLKERRLALGLTLEEVGRMVGVQRATIQRYESAVISKIPSNRIESLAKALKTTPSYLMGWTDDPSIHVNGTSNAPETHRYVRVNVYGTIPAGIPIEAIEDIIDWEDIPEDWCRGGKEFFALQVKGDSMFPDYIEGDTIICEVTPDFFDGDDCVVYVNGYDATLKRCFHKGADILLEPVNSQYAPQLYRIAEDIEPYATNVLSARVLGVVRELRRKPNRYR